MGWQFAARRVGSIPRVAASGCLGDAMLGEAEMVIRVSISDVAAWRWRGIQADPLLRAALRVEPSAMLVELCSPGGALDGWVALAEVLQGADGTIQLDGLGPFAPQR